MTVPVVSIPLDEYLALQNDRRLLEALRNAGVDNWDGYSEACHEAHRAQKTRLDD